MVGSKLLEQKWMCNALYFHSGSFPSRGKLFGTEKNIIMSEVWICKERKIYFSGLIMVLGQSSVMQDLSRKVQGIFKTPLFRSVFLKSTFPLILVSPGIPHPDQTDCPHVASFHPVQPCHGSGEWDHHDDHQMMVVQIMMLAIMVNIGITHSSVVIMTRCMII